MLQNGSFNNGNVTANNQYYGMPYDAAGNLLSTGFMSLTWDAESKLVSAGGATYIYDGNGDRVEKQGVGVTDSFYFGGRPIARLDNGQWTDLIYGPTGLLAEVPGTENANPVYRLTDHLGNVVGETDINGTVSNPMDYTPFGQVFAGSTNDPYLFTGKERDAESGLDNFGARYFASNIGRWMSPDWSAQAEPIPYAKLADPQSLNLYAYVGNNPLSQVDADGHIYNGASESGMAGGDCNDPVACGHNSALLSASDHVEYVAAQQQAQQTNAADNNDTFTLNGQPMSSIVGPDGVATPAFSGFRESKDDPSKTGDAYSGPLPTGSYYIVDRPSGGLSGKIKDFLRPEKGTWFALYRNDGKIDDSTTVNGTVRGSFRLHPKGPLGISEGCITVNSQSDYIRLSFQLMSAKPANIPGTSIRYYGTMEVK